MNRELRALDDGLFAVMAHRLSPLPHHACLLVNGDATDKRAFKGAFADLIVTSPPYNVGKAYSGDAEDDGLSYQDYMAFTRCWMRNCYHWTHPTGRMCVNVALDKNRNGKTPLSADVTAAAIKVGWKYHATIIWNENNISKRTAWGSWKSASAPHIIAPIETVLVFYKDQWKRERQGVSDITADEFKDWVFGTWTFPGESAKRIGHEAPFPRELPKRCIKLLSFAGDTVFDPLAGSGTTMIEAASLGRTAVGLELESRHCDLIRARMKKECKVQLQPCSKAKAVKSTLTCWAA